VQHFSSDGVDIAYRLAGEGAPVLLIHGFASNSAVNWGSTGWIDTLTAAGRTAIAMDVRGHGESARPRDPAAYRPEVMAADAARLLDHVGVAVADVMGYSMGARIATFLALGDPRRVRSLVLGGMGWALVEGPGDAEEVAAALEADSAGAVTGETGRGYRRFAEKTGSDLRALAACIRAQRVSVAAARLADVAVPVMVAVGTGDRVAGSAARLARAFPRGEALDIPGRDHMLATGDRVFKAAVVEFLARVAAGDAGSSPPA
jgi:pimeloyl-ACP methyl ester carboxylesterase